MKVIETQNVGPRGHGRVEVIDNNRARVTITDREGKTSTNDLEYSQGVAMTKIGNWRLQSVEDVQIQLTPFRDDIKYIRPLKGTFYVEFARFGAEPGELPTIRWEEPKEYDGKPWLPARYRCFPLYEVVAGGQYSGMEILDIMTYEFEWDDVLKEFLIVGSKRRVFHDQVLNFLNVFGFDLVNDNIKNPGDLYEVPEADPVFNVLSQIETILRERKKLAQVSLEMNERGWTKVADLRNGPFGMTRQALESAVAQSNPPPEREQGE